MLELRSQTMSTEPDYLHRIFEINNPKMSVCTCVCISMCKLKLEQSRKFFSPGGVRTLGLKLFMTTVPSTTVFLNLKMYCCMVLCDFGRNAKYIYGISLANSISNSSFPKLMGSFPA